MRLLDNIREYTNTPFNPTKQQRLEMELMIKGGFTLKDMENLVLGGEQKDGYKEIGQYYGEKVYLDTKETTE